MECDQADVCVFIVGATDPHGSNGHVDRIRRSASRRKGKASSADERRIRAKDVLIKKTGVQRRWLGHGAVRRIAKPRRQDESPSFSD